MTCRRCLQVGHNKRTCKNEAVNIPPNTRVKSGFGVMGFEGTGNIYAKMPGDKRVRHLNSIFEPGFSSRGRGGSRGRGAGSTLGHVEGSFQAWESGV
ncbi:MuDR family transposase [Perilla frutescens var. hirtella]|nr:MuDR family transposase [Perilla frutescens var. hirtella]